MSQTKTRIREYVMGRTHHRRPTCQHRLLDLNPSRTQCGIDLTTWPWKTYQTDRIPFMTCLRCCPDEASKFES